LGAGADWAAVPHEISFAEYPNTQLEPVDRQVLLWGVEQGLMKPDGKRREYEVARKAEDPLSITFQDYDWADEVLHAQFGVTFRLDGHVDGDRRRRGDLQHEYRRRAGVPDPVGALAVERLDVHPERNGHVGRDHHRRVALLVVHVDVAAGPGRVGIGAFGQPVAQREVQLRPATYLQIAFRHLGPLRVFDFHLRRTRHHCAHWHTSPITPATLPSRPNTCKSNYHETS